MNKKVFEGQVYSTKMDKTIVVKVWRKFVHPKYKKVIVRAKKYYVHSTLVHKEGELVRIRPTAPISATKRWEIFIE